MSDKLVNIRFFAWHFTVDVNGTLGFSFNEAHWPLPYSKIKSVPKWWAIKLFEVHGWRQ